MFAFDFKYGLKSFESLTGASAFAGSICRDKPTSLFPANGNNQNASCVPVVNILYGEVVETVRFPGFLRKNGLCSF